MAEKWYNPLRVDTWKKQKIQDYIKGIIFMPRRLRKNKKNNTELIKKPILPTFLNHRNLREIGRAVLPDTDTQKATIGEQPAAATRRFLEP